MQSDVVVIYRRVPHSRYDLGYLIYDPQTQLSRRYTSQGELIDAGGTWVGPNSFHQWLRTYSHSWSRDVSDAWWIKGSDSFVDVGL